MANVCGTVALGHCAMLSGLFRLPVLATSYRNLTIRSSGPLRRAVVLSGRGQQRPLNSSVRQHASKSSTSPRRLGNRFLSRRGRPLLLLVPGKGLVYGRWRRLRLRLSRLSQRRANSTGRLVGEPNSYLVNVTHSRGLAGGSIRYSRASPACCLTIRSSGPLRRVAVLSCCGQQRPLNSSVREHGIRPKP